MCVLGIADISALAALPMREGLLKVLNKNLDVCDALASFVARMARYCPKLQLEQLASARVFDAIEDFEFGRELRGELDLLGGQRAMSIGEKSRFQSAHVVFFDPRRGFGRVLTGDDRKAYLPRQTLIDADLIALESGSTIEVALDELNSTRVERLRIPAPVEWQSQGKKA